MKPALPVFFAAPDEPFSTGAIAVSKDLTPGQFTRRVIFAAKRYTIPGALLIIAHQVGEALVPIIMGLAIDRALATGNGTELVLWTAVLAADFAMLSFAFRFGSRVGLYGMESVQHQLRMLVTDKLLHPAGVAGPASLPGVSLSIATNDVYILARSIQIGVYPLGQLVGVGFCAIMLLTMSWQLGLAVIIGAPAMLVIMGLAGGPLQRRSRHQQELGAQAAGSAADLVAGYRVLRGIGAEAEAASRYASVSNRALDGTLAAKATEGTYDGSMDVISGLFVAALAVGAGLQAVSGQLTVGELIAVVGLTQFLIGPLGSLASNVGAVWAESVASATRVLSVLQAAPAVPTPTVTSMSARVDTMRPSTVPVVEIELDPQPGTAAVVVRVEPGECVGIVCSAQQARALVRLLAARTEAAAGQLLIGAVDARQLGLNTIRSTILVAPHEADLFDGSIADNVRLGAVSANRLAAAYRAAGCEEIIESLPAGLDTQVGEGGARLSGGQRQRVALARALAADAPVLVLQDPTTAVDSVTEAGIAARLRGMRSGASTILITSSPALLAECDRVIDAMVGDLV